jgi:hypothetical protein
MTVKTPVLSNDNQPKILFHLEARKTRQTLEEKVSGEHWTDKCYNNNRVKIVDLEEKI